MVKKGEEWVELFDGAEGEPDEAGDEVGELEGGFPFS